MATANSIDSLKWCVGKKIVGCLQGAVKSMAGDSTRTFIFSDGTGFTFTSSGAYWVEDMDSINKIREEVRRQLKQLEV